MLENVVIIKKDVKHIILKVKPTGEVILTVPEITSDEHVTSVLQKRKKWIIEKQEFFKTFQASEKEYVSGEDFKYLGKSYRLKIVESQKEKVKLQRGFLEVYIKNKNDLQQKQKLIFDWYYEKSLLHFFSLLHRFNQIVNANVTHVKIRQMKTRWGSCNPHKSFINLNIELIKKHKECIEYVIFHELAHFIHPNHSKEFYNYLSIYMPDWQKRKEKLEKL